MALSFRRHGSAFLAGTMLYAALAWTSARAEITTASGADYASLCQANGVPLPPKWGTSDWRFNGKLQSNQVFIVVGREAFVYYAQSPQGLCMTLPRPLNSSVVPRAAFGVICQGTTGGVCFWDNTRDVPWDATNGATVVSAQVVMASTNPADLDGNFIGGGALANHNGGMCTDCHAGRNPYIVMPGYPTDLRSVPISQDTPVWYNPLVPAGWLQNAGPSNVLVGVAPGPGEGSCSGCHADPPLVGRGGVASAAQAGKFPALWNLPVVPPLDPRLNYCTSVLDRAKVLGRMPPGAGNATTHWNAITAACAQPPNPQADTAAFVTHTQPPLPVTPGQVFNIAGTFRNTGIVTWAGRQTIEALPPTGPAWNASTATVGTATAPITPTNIATQSITLTVPAQTPPGNYPLTIAMFTPTPTGKRQLANGPALSVQVASANDNGAIVTVTAPGSLPTNGSGTVSVTLRNNGASTWSPGGYLLKLNRTGRVSLPVNTVALPSMVAPGTSITLTFAVGCTSAGTGTFSVQMSNQNGVFGQSTGRTIVCQ